MYSDSQSTDLIILESSVNLTAQLEPSEQYLDQTFTVNGSISEIALAQGNITIDLNGQEIFRQNAVETNWSFDLLTPSDLAAGDYTVIVSFESSNASLPDEKVNLDFRILGSSEILLDSDSIKITRK